MEQMMIPKLCQAQLRAPPGSKDREEGSLGQEVWGGPHTVSPGPSAEGPPLRPPSGDGADGAVTMATGVR